MALNLRHVEASELTRGMAVAAVGAVTPALWPTLAIQAVDGAPPLRNGLRLQGIVGAQEFEARLRLLDRDVLEPGESGFAQLHCATPVATPARERGVLRLPSPVGVLAGGEILDTALGRQRRNCRPVLERLETLSTLAPAQLVGAEVERAGMAGASLGRLAQLSALSQATILELLQARDVVVTRSSVVVEQGAVEQLADALPARLSKHPEGLAHDKLLASLPGVTTSVLDLALSRLVMRGLVVKRGGQLMLARPDEDAARARDEAAVAAQIAAALREAGLTPPDPKALVTDVSSKRAVDRLLKSGVIVRAVDQAKGREILFHRDAIEEAQARVAERLAQGDGVLVSEIGDALGISRKYSMPLLAHLYSLGFTWRVGDRRIRGPARSD